jgi:pyroglutamyl-peptidase
VKPSASPILVTGFGPFGSEQVNPSGLVAERCGGLRLPVAAEEAWALTRAEMKRRRAVAVLALGVAGGRDRVCVEKWAANEAAYALADDAGRVLAGVLDAGEAAGGLATGLPAAALARAMRGAGVPARVSRDAGRYVCNHFYFLLLRRLAGRAVFVHVPRLPEEAARLGGGPSLSLDQVEGAVRAGLRLMERRLTLT